MSAEETNGNLHTPRYDKEEKVDVEIAAAQTTYAAVLENLREKLERDQARIGQPEQIGLNYSYRKKGLFFQLTPIDNGVYFGITSNKKVPGERRNRPVEPLYIDEAGRPIIGEGFSIYQPIGVTKPIIQNRATLFRDVETGNIKICPESELTRTIDILTIASRPADLIAMGRLAVAVSDLSEASINFPRGARPSQS